jgi:hypothetical protein
MATRFLCAYCGQIKSPLWRIRVERKRELAAVNAVVRAIVELGHLRRADKKLFWDGQLVGPRELRGYLARQLTFLQNEKSVVPPWPIVLAVLARATRGELPVRDEAGAS